MPKALKDAEYTLKDGAAWIILDGASIRIRRNPFGSPVIEIVAYQDGNECDDPLGQLYFETPRLSEKPRP